MRAAPVGQTGGLEHVETLVRLGIDDAGEVLTLQRAAYVTEARAHGDLGLVHLQKPRVSASPHERTAMSRLLTLLPVLDQETDRLLATVRGFGDDDVRRPSLLPGWTRGHLLTHIARSGDVLRGLAEGIVSGVPATGYASDEARNAAIDAGADRPAHDLAADVAASATAFRAALLAVPETAADELLRLRPGVEFPARTLPVLRLVEVVLHHTDLDAGYTSQDWPSAFTTLKLAEPQATWRAERQTATR